ncbi:MAG TPA: helix-turn-helix domain-containing protein [Rhizomicrobium sp.]|jgi:DNA-binding MarR family transcriptional regulator
MAQKKAGAAGRRKLTRADYEMLAEFRHLIRQFLAFSEEAARAAGVTAQQHRALLAIKAFDADEPPTVGHLAARLVIQHHSAVGLVDRLVQARLVTRHRDTSDLRRTTLRLTARGDKTLHSVTGANRDELRRLTPLLKPLMQKIER